MQPLVSPTQGGMLILRCAGLENGLISPRGTATLGVFSVAKVWGGNRTWAGAQTQQILVSIMRTCWQQDRDAFPYLILLQRSRDPHILDIVPAAAQAAALLESKTASRP